MDVPLKTTALYTLNGWIYEMQIISQQSYCLFFKSNNPTFLLRFDSSSNCSGKLFLETSVDGELAVIHKGGCLDKQIFWI